jgi:hypothetical protein
MWPPKLVLARRPALQHYGKQLLVQIPRHGAWQGSRVHVPQCHHLAGLVQWAGPLTGLSRFLLAHFDLHAPAGGRPEVVGSAAVLTKGDYASRILDTNIR